MISDEPGVIAMLQQCNKYHVFVVTRIKGNESNIIFAYFACWNVQTIKQKINYIATVVRCKFVFVWKHIAMIFFFSHRVCRFKAKRCESNWSYRLQISMCSIKILLFIKFFFFYIIKKYVTSILASKRLLLCRFWQYA